MIELIIKIKFRNVMQSISLAVSLALFFLSMPARAISVPTVNSFASDACLPFTMISSDEIFRSPRAVYAHYFYPFPLSIDNKDASKDYYSLNYLVPSGENNKWQANGGFLRSRPLPVQINNPLSFRLENMKREIRLAILRGIAGFTFDIMSLDDIKPGGTLDILLEASIEVDPRFQIIPMPDMGAMGPNVDNVQTIIKTIYDKKGILHSPDGRPVIAPFMADAVSPEKWRIFLAQMADGHRPVSFMPTFLSLPGNLINGYADISDAIGTFATAVPSEGDRNAITAKMVRAAGIPFMAGVSGQDYRPKDYVFWEADNSRTYRNAWLGAIKGNADSIQLTTWSDFSESTQVEPYTDAEGSSGTGYFNLTGYYASWFLIGKPPRITHDVLYFFYRKESVVSSALKAGKQTFPASGSSQGEDMIELLGFLTKPGTLSVSIGGHQFHKSVKQGVQSFIVPLEEGKPRFTLSRGGNTVIAFDGNPAIAGPHGLASGYSDLTYWSGSASASGTCMTDAVFLP